MKTFKTITLSLCAMLLVATLPSCKKKRTGSASVSVETEREGDYAYREPRYNREPVSNKVARVAESAYDTVAEGTKNVAQKVADGTRAVGHRIAEGTEEVTDRVKEAGKTAANKVAEVRDHLLRK